MKLSLLPASPCVGDGLGCVEAADFDDAGRRLCGCGCVHVALTKGVDYGVYKALR